MSPSLNAGLVMVNVIPLKVLLWLGPEMTYDLWVTEILKLIVGVGRKSETETLPLVNTDMRKQIYTIVSMPGLAIKLHTF